MIPSTTHLTPPVYLKHLVFDGHIAVSDPRIRKIVLRLTEDEARALIAAKRIRTVGTRRHIKALHWIGAPLTPLQSREPPAESIAGGKDIRSRRRYSHNHDTQSNPQNVWTLIHLSEWMKTVFLAVLLDCTGNRKQ